MLLPTMLGNYQRENDEFTLVGELSEVECVDCRAQSGRATCFVNVLHVLCVCDELCVLF